jgi:hypothetical protein
MEHGMWGEGGDDGAGRAADVFAREADLALPPELRPVLARRLRRRQRANLVALWVAIVAGLSLSLAGMARGAGAGPGQGLDGGGVAAIVLATVAVGQLAQAGAALAAQAGDVAARSRQAPRASHLPRPRLGDYLAPTERWLARGLAAAAVLAALLLAAARPGPREELLVVAAACLGIWAVIELMVRAVVRARPAATDHQSLAFDDALRAGAVRRLLGASAVLPFAVGLFAIVAGLGSAGTALVVLWILGSVALSLLGERPGARARYRRRLWPAARG